MRSDNHTTASTIGVPVNTGTLLKASYKVKALDPRKSAKCMEESRRNFYQILQVYPFHRN